MKLKQLFARIPQELPATLPALEQFTTATLSVFSLPNTSEYQRAVATAIQQATQGGSHKVSKYAVYSFIVRHMAMRSAFIRIQDMNQELKLAPKQESDVKEAAQIPSG